MQIGNREQLNKYARYQGNTKQNEHADSKESTDYQKFLMEKKEEILEKIRNGNTEATYQIGAQSFTETEWDKFLENFDETEEVIRELMRERHEKQEAEQIEKERIEKENMELYQIMATRYVQKAKEAEYFLEVRQM